MTRDEYIESMKPVPKRSTTSYCTTADSSGSTPIRTADVESRRAAIHAMTHTPESQVQKFWDAAEAKWAARTAAYEKEKADEQAALRRAEHLRAEAAQREADRQRKVADFKFDDDLVAHVIESHGLSRSEAAVVHQRLLNSGNPHNTDLADIACQEIVLKRGTTPVNDAPALDWRPGLSKNKSRR